MPAVSGTVFLDLNMNGTLDAGEKGVAGVTVRATAANGATVSAVTGAAGTYTLATEAADLRLEFSAFPEGTRPGPVAGTAGPVTRFLTAASPRTGVNLALSTPLLVTTQFYYDKAAGGVNQAEGAVLAVPYGATGTPLPTVLATVKQVGSVWGLATQPGSGSVYAASFVKRHAGLGPNATGTGTTTGGIYRILPTAGGSQVSLLIDLNAVGGFDAGLDPHPGVTEDMGGDWYHDPGTTPTVGKRGLGGLAVSPDGRTLYTVNLHSRELIEIPLKADGTLDGSRSLRRTPIPLDNPAGSGIPAANFNAGNLRPFAVAVKGNAVFVGVTYTAEVQGTTANQGSAADLRAFVYAYDPGTGSFRAYNPAAGTFASGTTPVLTANLNYSRGVADDLDPATNPGGEILANWQPWTPGFDTGVGQPGYPIHPEPWLTDLVFDGEAMILGLRDRAGDKGGFTTGNGSVGNEDPFSQIAVGDILRAAPDGPNGWKLEHNASAGGVTTAGANNGQGPGNGEFYYQDHVPNDRRPLPADVGMGGLAQVAGFNTVAATGIDPLVEFSGGIYTFHNTTGKLGARAQVYASDTLDTFGSANGLGDLLAYTAVGTTQAGDRVWADTNGNGLQDPGEPGLPGVTVGLYQGNTPVGTRTTGAGGEYLFDGLLPGTAYEIRVATTQAALAGRTLAQAPANGNAELTSKATASGTTAVVPFTTGEPGTTRTDLDVGFAGTASSSGTGTTPDTTVPTFAIGDLVFRDLNGNGKLDTGETGIPGVLVELLDGNGTPVAGKTATTDFAGGYRFTGLATGSYKVRLAASNFNTGAPLAGFTSSGPTSGDPNDGVNNDDNGIPSGTLGSGGVVTTGTITLLIADNLTVDFGLVPPAPPPPPPPTFKLGNRVFRDANGNGTQDAGEPGIGGVLVELLDGSGNPIPGKTTTTNSSGEYTFSGLPAGTYRVRLAASNFNTGKVLARFTSSGPTSGNPNDLVDGNDNGLTDGTLGSGGVVITQPVTLSTADNLTVDFGLVPPSAPSAGTLSLTGKVWNDGNNNGIADGGESGLNGLTVQLLSPSGAVLQTTTTANGGVYSFTNLPAGNYRVRLAAANFGPGGALVGFTSSTGKNGSATGPVEPAADPNTVNDQRDSGQVVGTLGQSGGVIQTGLLNLQAGGRNTLDFGVYRRFSVGNTVFHDRNNNGTQDAGEPGLGGVAVRLLAADGTTVIGTTTTNNAGNYLFNNLAAGTYVVELAAGNFNTGGRLFNFRSSTGPTNAFEPAPATGPDRQDRGTTQGTLGSGGTVRATVTVGPDANLPTGETPNTDPGTPDNQANLTVDFGLFQLTLATASVSGRVFLDYNHSGTVNGPDAGLGGVTLTLSGGGLSSPLTVKSDDKGFYSFTNLPAGTYTLTQTPPTSPAHLSGKNRAGTAGGQVAGDVISTIVLRTGQQAGGYNFAEVPLLSTGGTVYEDRNGNGTQDAGEPGIEGVTVTLTGTSVVSGAISPRTAVTNAQGQYTFTGLTPGTYNLKQTQPAGYADGAQQTGTPAARIGANEFIGINLTTTAAPSGGFNFGEVKASSIGGVVFDDGNDDGAQTAGEPGIPGVTVRLTGANDRGQRVDLTTTTGSDGAFNFGGLRPGKYTLTQTQPKGYADGKDAAGTAGGNVSVNDQISGIALGSGVSATGYRFAERATADVVVTQTPPTVTIAPGGTATLTYTVRNTGTGRASGVEVLVNYGGLTYISASAPAEFNTTTRKWTVGDLAPGASKTLTLVFQATGRGTFTPTSRVSSTVGGLGGGGPVSASTVYAGTKPAPKPQAKPAALTGTWFLSSSLTRNARGWFWGR